MAHLLDFCLGAFELGIWFNYSDLKDEAEIPVFVNEVISLQFVDLVEEFRVGKPTIYCNLAIFIMSV